MKIYGTTELQSDKPFTNLIVPGGSEFPAASQSELFSLADHAALPNGLYHYSDGEWTRVSGNFDPGSYDSPPGEAEFQYEKSTPITNTVIQAPFFVVKARLTTRLLSGGTYRIAWSYIWSSEGNQVPVECRLDIDGSEVWHTSRKIDNAGDYRGTGAEIHPTASAIDYVTLGAGIHVIELKFATTDSNFAASMWNAVIEFWKA
jgi:hypothetical protein